MRGSLGSPNSSNKNTGGKANIDLKVEKPIPIKSRRVLPSRSPRIVTSLPAETGNYCKFICCVNFSVFCLNFLTHPTFLTASAPLLDNTEVSPPRHEGTDVVGSKAVFGDGVFLTDAELVTLLKMPPKSTAVLRTRGSFQEYFRGISLERMKKLLDAAYSDVSDLSEKETKINKRMNLLTQASK